VVFISSFFRSGNTWTRFLLTDILLQIHGVETQTQLAVHPDDLIPELHFNSIARRLSRCPRWAAQPPETFVKTHFLFAQLAEVLSASRPAPKRRSGEPELSQDYRVLYLYRSPEDALVSFYHLCGREAYLRSRASEGIDAFCQREVSGWIENVSSYLRAADQGFPIFFVSYECLLEKPAIVLANLLHWLQMGCDPQMIERAVSNMQFCKLQDLEIQANKARNLSQEQNLFFRRGRQGSGDAELKESTLQEIRQRTASLLSEANHHQMKQPSQQPLFAEKPLRNGEARHNGEVAAPLISSRLLRT
jgi:hypothetical protein